MLHLQVGAVIFPLVLLLLPNFFIIEILGRKFIREAPVFLSFFSHFISLFLTGQTPFEDDFLEDKWLKLLPP